MSGYLPPHTKKGMHSKIYTPAYPIDKTTDSPVSTPLELKKYSVYLPHAATPTINTVITFKIANGEELVLPVLGFGCWSFGDVLTYGWSGNGSKGYDQNLNEESIDAAIKKIQSYFPHKFLLDVAEHYGYTNGEAEKQIGRQVHSLPIKANQIVLATKYLPNVFRQPFAYPGVVETKMLDSLERLNLPKISLYQVHGPSHWGFWPPLNWLIDGFIQAYKSGKIEAVGTCNLSYDQVKHIYDKLKAANVPYVSHQIEFSLLRIDPWKDGLIQKCRDLGLATIAYSPIAVGRLSGKYNDQDRPRGNRNFGDIAWTKIQPVVNQLHVIGEQVKKTPTAVALNWVMCKGAIPIPAVKNDVQVEDIVSSLGWRLTDDQVQQLDDVAVYHMGGPYNFDWRIFKHFQNWWWEQG